MNTRSLIAKQNLARNSQCSQEKPNQSTSITGQEVDDVSNRGICSSVQSLDKENPQVGVAFSFHKAKKDNKQF